MIKGLRGGSEVYFCGDGHYYHVNKKKNGKIYLRCYYFYKHRCYGRALCNDDLTGFKITQAHTFSFKTRSLPEVRRLRRKILNDCLSRNPAKFSNIVWNNSHG